MDKEAQIIVERLTNLGLWELYRFADEESDSVICKVALCIGAIDEVEYGIWRGEDAEPSAMGSVEWNGSEWNDQIREDKLREILSAYKNALPEIQQGLDFQIGEPDDLEDDGDEDEAYNAWEEG